LSYEEYQEKVANLKTLSDTTDFAKSLVAPTLQAMLDGEMEQHLGYPKGARTSSKNSHNSSYKKKIKTSMGDAEMAIPQRP